MHTFLNLLAIVVALGVISSCIYCLICLWAAAGFARDPKKPASADNFLPPVSILKPLKGIDPEIYESFRSHCAQDYPKYEIIFGVSEPDDPVIEAVRRLQQEFPERKIRLVECKEKLGTNIKVSNLAQMLPATAFEYLTVNDSDIRVPPDYLRRVISLLRDDGTGMVTCPYRGVPADTLGSRLEALGISTDFCPSVLVARRLEGIRFALGSTMAFRRKDLQKIGGFEAIVDYLADDYELGKRIAGLSLNVHLADLAVETFLPPYSLGEFFAHQVRWARGVRDARRGGYLGLIFTFGTFWATVALLASRGAIWTWAALAAVLALRWCVALRVGAGIIGDSYAKKNWWLLPLRDLCAAGVWFASLFGHTVTWRGERYVLKNGKLSR